jgi:hypothetical protein
MDRTDGEVSNLIRVQWVLLPAPSFDAIEHLFGALSRCSVLLCKIKDDWGSLVQLKRGEMLRNYARSRTGTVRCHRPIAWLLVERCKGLALV